MGAPALGGTCRPFGSLCTAPGSRTCTLRLPPNAQVALALGGACGIMAVLLYRSVAEQRRLAALLARREADFTSLVRAPGLCPLPVPPSVHAVHDGRVLTAEPFSPAAALPLAAPQSCGTTRMHRSLCQHTPGVLCWHWQRKHTALLPTA